MKKWIALVLTFMMVISMTACSSDAAEGETTNDTAESQDVTEDQGTVDETGTSGDGTGNVLVAYFSATGTTEGVAETIAETLNADLYEITPAEPYTDDDLDYNDDDSRSTIEMNDPDARPEIEGSVENMEQYDVVFLGYPIWWGEAPRIMSTFVESYDFNGKTVIPFCTSGGSGIGSSGDNLEALTSGAQWLEGERFSSGVSQDEIAEWISGLGLDLATE